MTEKLQRRAFLKNSVTGLGIASVAGAGLLHSSNAAAETTLPAATENDSPLHNEAPQSNTATDSTAQREDLTQLIAPYSVGSNVGQNTITEMTTKGNQVGVLTLKSPCGRRMAVEICELNSKTNVSTKAISNTKSYSLYLRNSGNGHTPTDESFGLSVMELGRVITKNEA
jgi:hypothetical protein